MGSCQKKGSLFWGTLNIRCRIILGTQKGTLISTTTHMFLNGRLGRHRQVLGLGGGDQNPITCDWGWGLGFRV